MPLIKKNHFSLILTLKKKTFILLDPVSDEKQAEKYLKKNSDNLFAKYTILIMRLK